MTVLSRHADANVLVSAICQSGPSSPNVPWKRTFWVNCQEHDLLFASAHQFLFYLFECSSRRRPTPNVSGKGVQLARTTLKTVTRVRPVQRSQGMTYIMRVSLESLLALPAHLPVPQLDRHIVTGRQHERLSGVDTDRSDVIGVRLEACDLF